MKNPQSTSGLDKSLLPLQVGYKEPKATLCIGLDVAWFGGSKSDPRSRYDFLAVALISQQFEVLACDCLRVFLNDRDLDAENTVTGLKTLINKYEARADRIVLAIDAPLQAALTGLPVRKPKPDKGTVKRRACEAYLNCKRKSIDEASGGAKGWHPNIQPGAPLAPRVESLLRMLSSTFEIWTPGNAEHPTLIVECFPAEALWSAKRSAWFTDNISASKAKAYKTQKGKRLTAKQVSELVETVLLPFGNVCKKGGWKDQIVSSVLTKIFEDSGDSWKQGEHYPGGKMLDDVVDSLICLATAIGYASGNAHVWQDLNHLEDGHIIGPSNMQQLT